MSDGYFDFFSSAVPEQWTAGDSGNNKGYIRTNLDIRALLQLPGEVCRFVERETHLKCSRLDADAVIKQIRPYTEPPLSYLETATSDRLAALRGRGSSEVGANAACNDMLLIFGARYEKALTPELKAYVEQLDVAGTEDARDLIDQAYEIIRKDPFKRPKAEFGPDQKGLVNEGLTFGCRGRLR